MAAYTPVHESILYAKETGMEIMQGHFREGSSAFCKSYSALVEKAMDYEKTSYRGLFNFVRYIEQLQAYQVDYGEVNLTGAAHAGRSYDDPQE